jgi:hypothetical protein
MIFSITGQEKCDLLIEVTLTAWAGLTIAQFDFKSILVMK